MENLHSYFVKFVFTLHQQTTRTMNPIRTEEQLFQQAKKMFINLYEQKFGISLYGILPNKSYCNQEYKKIKSQCISICKKYKDIELQKHYELNF